MKRHLLLLSAVLLLASPLSAQTIGVYFDQDGTSLYGFSGTVPEFATGYVLVKDLNDLCSGAAFTVDIDPQITYFPPSWAADSIVLGDLVNGVEIGLDLPLPVFGTGAAMLGSFVMVSEFNINNAPITVGTHPNYATPVVTNAQALQFPCEGLTSYLKFNAIPTVCVYFDEAGTQTDTAYIQGTGLNAYVMVRDAEMLVSGAAFKLDALDPVFDLFATIYAPGVVQGNLYDGVEIGLYSPVPVFGTDVALMVTMALFVPENETPVAAEFEIVPHPDYETIVVSDSFAYQYPANSCGVSTVDVPIPNEDLTWGTLKALYR